MVVLAILFGAVVGFALGLTGGGGAIFAVPLLVYGLSIAPSEAVGISLAAVGVMAALGLVARWRAGQVELKTGLIFALAGMLGTPLGSWLSGQLPAQLLLLLFAGLMLIVAVRMWSVAAESKLPVACAEDDSDEATCRRDSMGKLRLTSRCAVLLAMVGVGTGILAGLFGVGGGFVIVPALVVFSGMTIHRAVGTSLLVISLISLGGVVSAQLLGREFPLQPMLLFIVGGSAGMWLGIRSSQYLSGPVLQRTFAVAIVAVALFVVSKNLWEF